MAAFRPRCRRRSSRRGAADDHARPAVGDLRRPAPRLRHTHRRQKRSARPLCGSCTSASSGTVIGSGAVSRAVGQRRISESIPAAASSTRPTSARTRYRIPPATSPARRAAYDRLGVRAVHDEVAFESMGRLLSWDRMHDGVASVECIYLTLPISYSDRVTIDEIETFVSIARLGGFARAAEGLHRSQPAISRRVGCSSNTSAPRSSSGCAPGWS